ncbi:MAG: dihydrofolate reductase [Gammaproteobacteria bacterium]|jgi:dihydrofolate reductase|nr:dihydrofolate reductase [Gammaproteobacteria bacterium]
MSEQVPLIALIAALAENRVIGRANRLPWHLPADLAHFKRLTLDKPILMGRRTWESLPGLLPRRRHIVITANPAYRALGCELASSPAAALALVQDEPEVLVIGGEMLYRTFLPAAGRLYLTLVATRIEDGDAFFPPWEPGEWVETGRETRARDEGNPFDLTFLRLDRAVVDGDDGVDGIPAT